jgi:hypothetical protein
MSGRRLTNCRPDHWILYLTFQLGTSWLYVHRLYVHPLFSAVHWFRIGIPVSHVEGLLCNPSPIMHRREAGEGGWYLFASYRQIISGPKMPNTRPEVRTPEWRLRHNCAVLQNGGKESLVPLLCNCVLHNTSQQEEFFKHFVHINTGRMPCIITRIISACLLPCTITHVVSVPASCPVLSHM